MSYERIPHFMGIDIGLKNDGTAVAICHIVKKETAVGLKDFIELDFIEVRYPAVEEREYFPPEEMAEWIATFFDKFFIAKAMMDQYYGLSIVPVLQEKGHRQVQVVNVNREFSSKLYQNLMIKMLDSSLRIPEGNARLEEGTRTTDIPLVKEMLRLQATVHSKYQITVKAPEIKSLHDDLSDAFARAVYLASEYLSVGGGVLKQISSQSADNVGSYRQYAMKNKKNAMFTKRPSSAVMQDAMRKNHLNSGISQRMR
jgi:hypothetical protein